MADNNKYIATWSDDLTSYSASSTYSRASIGHGIVPAGFIECIVSVWVCNSSNKSYEISVSLAGGALTASDLIGDDFILPPMSTVVFNGAAEKFIHSGNINFILTNNSQPAPSAGEVVAHVTIEYTEPLS